MKITVVALGKIGLPLAVQMASKGHAVLGVDVNQAVVDLVNRGMEPFPGETGLQVRLTDVVESGHLTATTDTAEAVARSEAVVVVVPLIVGDAGTPEFGPLEAATRAIGEGLQPGTLISYETTLPVGTTRNRLIPILTEKSELVVGKDFFVVFSPERVLTGRVFQDLRRYPKLVGGVDEGSTKRGVAFYEAVLDFDARSDTGKPIGVWDLGSAEAAELAKLAETTYRYVNIGLANQFARFADSIGVNIYQVIEAANSQPFSSIHRPGIAVGGHCIPVYPQFYLWNDPHSSVVRAARDANVDMPKYAVDMLNDELGDPTGVKVAVLGAAYRGGVKETAFSGAFPTVAALSVAGADVVVHDPMFDDAELQEIGFTPYHLDEPVDAAIIQTDHAEYAMLSPERLPGVKILVDGRNITNPRLWHGVVRRVIGAPA